MASIGVRSLSRTLTPRLTGKRFAQLAGAGVVTYGLQKAFGGPVDNIFDHRFTTTKDCDSLADFYGSEDFMEIFCVFPVSVHKLCFLCLCEGALG